MKMGKRGGETKEINRYSTGGEQFASLSDGVLVRAPLTCNAHYDQIIFHPRLLYCYHHRILTVFNY